MCLSPFVIAVRDDRRNATAGCSTSGGRAKAETMTGLLQNKVVIVAGLGGIGNGLAGRYADEGALLVLGDLDAELASRIATELDPSAQRVHGVALDGSDEASVIGAVDLAVGTFGRLDGVHLSFTNAADAYL